MKVQLDENNYFTGNYAIIGDIDGGIEVSELPDLTENKSKAWKYENNTWIFDEEKYKTILLEIKAEEERQSSIMTNEELTEYVNDLGDIIIDTGKGELL